MNHLVSSYTIIYIYGLLMWGREGWGKMGTRSHMSERFGRVGCMEGLCCYQAMSKLIIDKSMVGIILCLIVLHNYTEV